MKKAQAISRYLVLGTLSASLFAGLSTTHASPNGNPPQANLFASTAFQHTWQRTDRPVNLGEVQRSYYWGPQPNTGGIMEDYLQGINGKRLVQYFDKSRMEINNPNGNPNDPFYVTNGLLTVELISGRMQVGNNTFVTRQPADIPLASDTDDPNAPTYISFQGVSDTPLGNHPESNRVAMGQFATKTITKAGQVGDDPSKANMPETKLAYYETITSHNIPSVTWEFLNMVGPIYNTSLGHNQVNQLSDPWYYAAGLPISEPYWAKVKIDNVPNVDVMIQAFERRVVTYVPSAPDGFKVQMSNIGQHYYQWRYGNNPTPPTVPPPPTETPNPSQPTATSVPPQPTATHHPAQSPTATPTDTPVHPASQFEGTWIIDERLTLLGPEVIVKLRISASGGNLTLHGFVPCATGMCDADDKTKQYTGEPFDITLAGIPLRITFINQGTKLQVTENQTEVLHFHKVTASDFEATWLSNSDNIDPAKLTIKANGNNLTVTRFDACGFDICEKETKTKQFTDEPFTMTLNGDTFKLSVESTGTTATAIKVNINDNKFPLFSRVDADSFVGTWLSVTPGLKLVITGNGNTLHIHSYVGYCIDPPCGPVPDYHTDVQFNGSEPVTFSINSLGYNYKLTFDRASGTRLMSIRTHAQEAPYTQYLTKTP